MDFAGIELIFRLIALPALILQFLFFALLGQLFRF